MKIVCIKDTCDDGKRVVGITLGKIYDIKNFLITPSGLNVILITQDDGNKHWYTSPDRFFLSLDEWRENQLDKLDI